MANTNIKILIVEDDVDLCEMINMVMKEAGFTTLCLNAGKEVIATVDENHPDVVLMDVMLGDCDGRDICKLLKNTPQTSHIPVVIVSATHDASTRHEKKCGADDYVKKPFDINQLIETVRKLHNDRILKPPQYLLASFIAPIIAVPHLF